jgi:protein TonB
MKKRILLIGANLLAILALNAQVQTNPAPTQQPKEQSTTNGASTPTQDNDESVYNVVEQKPLFPGCEDVADYAERVVCAEKKMVQFIYENLKYPEEDKKNNVQGTVLIRFIVEKDGSISNTTIKRSISPSCEVEALRVLNMFPKWNPAKQRGKPVRIY